MCNLYKMTRTVDEVARLFRADADPPGNAGDTVYPGYPGYVVAEGRVRQMTWGFPLAMRGKSGQLRKVGQNSTLPLDSINEDLTVIWREHDGTHIGARCQGAGAKTGLSSSRIINHDQIKV